jgi:hypothetical protein
VLTVVFRRPRKPVIPEPADAVEQADGSRSAAGTPPAAPSHPPALPARLEEVAAELEDVEVIEAELLDPEAYYGQRPQRDWWA